MPLFEEGKQKKKLQELHEKEEEELLQLLSKKYKIPYTNLIKTTIDLDYLKIITEESARAAKMVIFQGVGKKIQVGLRNPDLELAQNTIKELERQDYEVQLFLVSQLSLETAWKKYKEVPEFEEMSKGVIDISQERVDEFSKEIKTTEDLKASFVKRVQSKENRRISELLEIILGGSLALDASDVHIEPREESVTLRMRLDGVLHEILKFDPRAYQLLLSRIKLVSEMKLNIKDKAQDGRFSIKAGGLEVEVRTSALPGPYGESLVLRVLNPKTISVAFEALGMHPVLQKTMEEEIARPNGMILNTGPTGSGKTTTLYAFLKKIAEPSVKIITLEEPIEYHLSNITQTQTNAARGYTFATGLRAILRQDPDVIMVGEIRDLEAAKIALNAALTGHLVFSTLHTNDAAGTIPRLIDLGANPAILAPAINVSMAQRLVRKLCKHCKQEYQPSKEETDLLQKVIGSFHENVEKPNFKKLFKAGSCEKCNLLGYKGRIGIFEAVLIDDEMEKIILTNPSITLMRQAAAKQPIPNMQQDAALKIINGETTIEEVKRIIELN